MSTLLGVFLILHGMVHLLYAGQAMRYFELRPGMTWPDGAWLFSKLLGDPASRWLATIALALAALGFLASGLGMFTHQTWQCLALTGSAIFSIAIFLLFWDGKIQALDDKGGVGILINLGILIAIWIIKISA